jgi:hypothetical protein
VIHTRNSAVAVAVACKAANMGLIPSRLRLSPDTEPAAIRRAQRRAVREAADALRGRGAPVTVAALSAEAVLPAWSVARRLAEMKAKIPVE